MSLPRAAREYWLRRAAEVRKSIDASTDPRARRTLEKLVAEYEALAERAAPPGQVAGKDGSEKPD